MIKSSSRAWEYLILIPFLFRKKIYDKVTTAWIGKDVPKYVSFSSNLMNAPNFLRISSPRDLVVSAVGALDGLAEQSETQIKLNFTDFETNIESKLNHFFSIVSQRC